MATKRVKKSPPPGLVQNIYARFQAKAAEISAKNLATFESAFKKIDYLEISRILYQLSQFKGLGR